MRSLEKRVDTIAIAIQEVHPDYSQRILSRMEDLERLARGHANSVMGILNNQTHALESAVFKARAESVKVFGQLSEASERHRRDGAAL